jgi:hypothetical protein
MTEPNEQPTDTVPKKSRLAITSFVLGILSLLSFGLLSLPCVICGHLASWKIKRGAVSGKRLAVAGLIMGYLGVLLFVGLIYWSNTQPTYRPYTLPSGKMIKLIALQKWAEAGEDNSLALLYQTDIDLNSKDELRKEAEHIWQFLRVNAEKEGMSKARILAHGPTTGRFVKNRSGFGFLIEKQEDGTWKFNDTSQ